MGAPTWTATTNGESKVHVEGLKDYIQGGHEPLARTKKKKKNKGVAKKQEEVVVEPGGVNGLDALLEAEELPADETVDSHSDDHENRPMTSSTDATNGDRVWPERESQMSPDDFSDVTDSMPISMDQLISDTKASPIRSKPTAPLNPNLVAITEWFSQQTGHAYQSLHPKHHDKILEHILNYKHPGSSPNWLAALRQCVWRTAVRSNFWWINPDTNEPTGKPKPVHRPDGLFESDYKLFVMCAAERLDRVGRDLPSPEYVQRIESQVRVFLGKSERGFKDQLAHLAFLLMWDEEQKRELRVADMAERVKRAFGATNFRYEGCEMFAPKAKEARPFKGRRGRSQKGYSSCVDDADDMWEDAQRAP